jgi:hypothetical protein
MDQPIEVISLRVNSVTAPAVACVKARGCGAYIVARRLAIRTDDSRGESSQVLLGDVLLLTEGQSSVARARQQGSLPTGRDGTEWRLCPSPAKELDPSRIAFGTGNAIIAGSATTRSS